MFRVFGVLAIAGCGPGETATSSARTEAEPAPTAPVQTTGRALRTHATPHRLDGASPEHVQALLAHLAARVPLTASKDAATPSRVVELTHPISGATFDLSRGSHLVDALAALPEEQQAYGIEGLETTALFGDGTTPGLCERPAFDFGAALNGKGYGLRYSVEPYTWWSEPSAVRLAASDRCVDALTRHAAAGDGVAAAVGDGCTAEEEASGFPDGSACRTCLDTDGDLGRCVTAGTCEATPVSITFTTLNGVREPFTTFEVETLACAPNLTARGVFLARTTTATPPAAFDPEGVALVCEVHWNPDVEDLDLLCHSESDAGLTRADALVGETEHIRPLDALPAADEAHEPMHGRVFLANRAEIDGHVFTGMPLYGDTLGLLSSMDHAAGGWGLHPDLPTPGAPSAPGDLADVDNTMARDWIAAVALKTASTTDAVPFVFFNRNLCGADTWQGPDAQGRSHCAAPAYRDDLLPEGAQSWHYDWGRFVIGSGDTARLQLFPLVTLAATGLMDEGIPGGHLPKVLGSTTLADPDWENCTWPDTFAPDEMANYDTPKLQSPTFTSQTVRFGSPGRVEIRAALATNRRRDFCFAPLPGP